MGKYIEIDGTFFISADSSYTDDRVRVLNHAESFGVFDRWGDIQPLGKQVQGLYHQGTRFLSSCELRMNGERPLLLGSSIAEENERLHVDLTNPEFSENTSYIHEGKIYIERVKEIHEGICKEKIGVKNFDTQAHSFALSLTFDTDFGDIFEVRGIKRERKGTMLGSSIEDDKIVFQYKGLDNILRKTWITLSPVPTQLSHHEASYHLSLRPQESMQIEVLVQFQVGKVLQPRNVKQKSLLGLCGPSSDPWKEHFTTIYSSNDEFNHWLNRSAIDLESLVALTPHGLYPYAGIPWFNTTFGRDGIISALMMLWLKPELAKGVLKFLAATQAQEEDEFKDAQPGKIVHEIRKGEMANTGEVPYKAYYGTIDATPLFIVLAEKYLSRTNDLQTIRELWPNILLALAWMDEYGDVDGDGFIEYIQKSEKGLVNQGWKDAGDAIFYENGEMAKGAIALCEVQGYVYAAKLAAAHLAAKLKNDDLAFRLSDEAKVLKHKFNKDFWDEGLGTFVMALDGKKQPCRVSNSNAGQCLFTGIVDGDKAKKLAANLLGEKMFSGWGIRTVATDAARYNPMSYHNGSVWPHDTALIGYGLSLYGYTAEALKIFNGLTEASHYFQFQRLPELFCGFQRRPGNGPTEYPVACSPQAWAVTSIYLMLQAVLNINIDAMERKITFHKPCLPEFLDSLTIQNLDLPGGKMSLQLIRYPNSLGINVIKNEPDWEIVLIK
jgi:glycogen debranching enzyme